MRYRHEIGHASANFAFVVKDCFPCTVRSDAVWGCIRDTLPLTSPCSGTNEKLQYLCFSLSTGGLILPLFQTSIAYNIDFIGRLSNFHRALSQFSQVYFYPVKT